MPGAHRFGYRGQRTVQGPMLYDDPDVCGVPSQASWRLQERKVTLHEWTPTIEHPQISSTAGETFEAKSHLELAT